MRGRLERAERELEAGEGIKKRCQEGLLALQRERLEGERVRKERD